jgi:hypothetical protein
MTVNATRNRQALQWDVYGPLIDAGLFIMDVQFIIGVLVNHTAWFHFTSPDIAEATVGDWVTFLRLLLFCAGGLSVICGCLLTLFGRSSREDQPVADSPPLPQVPRSLLRLPDEDGLRTRQQVLDYLAARGIRQEVLAQLREGGDQ